MPRTPTTPAQVSGHRFLVRRVEHALVRADAAMLHDPQRTRGRALAAGAALAVLAVAGAAVLGLVRPGAGSADDADLLMVRGTGALHVRIGDRLHPVDNLASARLVLGRPEQPRRVGAGALEGVPAGPPLGVPGAPAVAPEEPAAAPATAGVCELVAADPADPAGGPAVARTVVRLGGGGRPDDGTATLAAGDGAHWLVLGGRRARVDPADPVLARALGLGSAQVRPAGPDWLRALPEAPPVAAPDVGPVGQPAPFPAPFDVVGRVVDVGTRSVAVTPAGAVDVGPVVADVLAALGGRAAAGEPQLAAVPVAPPVDPGSLPEAPPRWAPAEGWLCADSDADGPAAVVAGEPAGPHVPYAAADGAGPAVDAYAGPAATVAADAGEGALLVSGAGLRHRVHGDPAVLGHPAPGRLPWRVLAALPEGPALSRAAALRAR
ncbi:type VII secretion protein EccB [Corynebacterium sp. 335C]